MFVKTKALVLKALKYQEKSLIVTCLTQSHGVKTFFVPTAFSSRKNQQKAAYFQPLTLLEIEFNHKNKGAFEYFKDIKIGEPYHSISLSITKNSIALFLSETLHNCLKENTHDDGLFEFLETALLWLDHHHEIANFHIITLLKTTKYLGFYPDTSQTGYYFDLLNGRFVNQKDIHSISESDTQLLQRALQLQFTDSQLAFKSTERQILLKIILDYYQIHIEKFKYPQSLDIYHEIFS